IYVDKAVALELAEVRNQTRRIIEARTQTRAKTRAKVCLLYLVVWLYISALRPLLPPALH
ncbi:hypothetical protein KIPB_016792, partial [Kipferlia bialata]